METKYKKLSTKNLFTCFIRNPENKNILPKYKNSEHFKMTKPHSPANKYLTVNQKKAENKKFHKKNSSTASAKTLISKIKELKERSKYMTKSSRFYQSSINLFQNSIPEDTKLQPIKNYFYSNIENCRNKSFNSLKDLKSNIILNSQKKAPKKYFSPENHNNGNNENRRNYNKIKNNNSQNNKIQNNTSEIINIIKRERNENLFDNEIKNEKQYQFNTFIYHKAKLSKILSPKFTKIVVNVNNKTNRCSNNKFNLKNKIPINNIISPGNKKKNLNYSTVNGNTLKNSEKFISKKFKRNNYNNNDNTAFYNHNNCNDLVKEIIINNNNNKFNNNSFNYYYNNRDTNENFNDNDGNKTKNNYFQNVIKKYLIENSNIAKNKQLTKTKNRNDMFENAFLVQKKILIIQKNYRMHLGKIKYNIIKTLTKFVNGINIITKLFLKKYLNELFFNVLINTSRPCFKLQKSINEIEINLKNNKNSLAHHKKAKSNFQFKKYQTKLIIKRRDSDRQNVEIETLSDSKNTVTEMNLNRINEVDDEIIKENFGTYNESNSKKRSDSNLFIQKTKFINKYYQVPNLDNILSINSSNIFYKIYNKDSNHNIKTTNNASKKFITYKKV